MRKSCCILLIVMAVVAASCGRRNDVAVDVAPLPADGFVAIEGGHFVVDGDVWFPLMLNYKAFFATVGDTLAVVPAPWYTGDGPRQHFDTIASWGFNAVRICLDGDYSGCDTAAMIRATRRVVGQADSAGLRVMLLIHPPFGAFWSDYTAALLRALADMPALWAYDFMNEPLYFDVDSRRDKADAVATVRRWRTMVRRDAPHQLFTIGLAEPLEVFKWDPSLLPVDFVEMHTYHPLRVQSEMWWYSRYCGKPWMVGETGLPADGDSVGYEDQQAFMWETYRCARLMGTAGYGWWEFQDCPGGTNFEARYTGLRDSLGRTKPAATLLHYPCFGAADLCAAPPVNYYNMLAYANVAATGTVVDSRGCPVEGAVVRGWNDDWSVGVNTFTAADGRFRLVSNDVCSHFEISAPGYSTAKFDRHLEYPTMPLPDRQREYQQIPLLGWGDDSWILPYVDDGRYAAVVAVAADMGAVKLRKMR